MKTLADDPRTHAPMPMVGQPHRDRQGLVWEVVRVEDENCLHRGGYRVLLRSGEVDDWWYDVELGALYADGGMVTA